MYKRNKIKKLGRTRTHREALTKNQLRALFTTGYVKTTTVKAKSLKMNADKMIGRIRKAGNELVLIRELTSVLGTRNIVESAVKYAKAGKAATKIMKVGFRSGDNAQISKIELVGYEPVKKTVTSKKRKAKEAKKTQTKTVEKSQIKQNRPNRKDLGSTIKEAFTGRQERARSRSGI